MLLTCSIDNWWPYCPGHITWARTAGPEPFARALITSSRRGISWPFQPPISATFWELGLDEVGLGLDDCAWVGSPTTIALFPGSPPQLVSTGQVHPPAEPGGLLFSH